MCARLGLNQGPFEYQSNALPAELRAQIYKYFKFKLHSRALGFEPRTFLYPARTGRGESVECSTSPRLAPPELGGVK